jgi:uncharacterized protein (DUF1501 family)
MGGIQSLFNDKKCAILANVGPLTQPTTKAQWNNAQPTIAVPSQLFSHADQQKVWQTGLPDRASETGWLGRMGDILVPTMQPSSGLSICISTSGDNTIQVGNSVTQYQITPNGAIKIEGLNNLYASNIGSALQDILTQSDGSHLMEDQYAAIVNRSISTESLVSTGLASSATINTVFADDPLSRQLKMVARLIAARTSFGHKRQIFFVGLGGFDFHGDLLRDQAARLKMVNDGLKSFYDASVELNVADQVTAFTASDFGRTLQSNGSGSDHGWGGHHFVVGGAVNGNRIAGTFPTVALGSPEDAGNGNLIPSTSVDQYAADLGRWFGITSANDLRTVMPNYERFSTASLGLFT